jgi:acetyl/propionyl-CoA carboxylase alpha subunit
MPGVRIDAGVAENLDVPVHYDPLLAKVIASAETRDLAIARLAAALRAYPILGIVTNIPFLLRVLEHPRFAAGEVDTGFLDGEGAALAELPAEEAPPFVHAAMTAADDLAGEPAAGRETRSRDPWHALRDFRP